MADVQDCPQEDTLIGLPRDIGHLCVHPDKADHRSEAGKSNMALVLIEEVLMGLEETKDALDQAVMTLEMLVEDLHPGLGNDLKTTLEREFLSPLQAHAAAMARLLEEVATRAET